MTKKEILNQIWWIIFSEEDGFCDFLRTTLEKEQLNELLEIAKETNRLGTILDNEEIESLAKQYIELSEKTS